MSVDKFGRHISPKSNLFQIGTQGEGFHITPDGDYDIKSKRLKYVNDPKDELDAVNLKTLSEKCLIDNGGVLDANGKLITNVYNDDTKFNGTDVANKKYIHDNFVRYNYSGNLGNIDAKRNLIKNVFDPQSPQDAATKEYVDKRTPEHGTHHWNFLHKRLVNVTNPIDLGDAVNMRYFQEHTPQIDMVEGAWSFSKYRLGSIAKPLKMDDAVNREYYKEGLAKLSYALYKLTRAGKSRSALISASDWRAKVMLSTSWDDLFK